MATIYVDLAQAMIGKLKKQKRPRIYCVGRYMNIVFEKECWAYFNNKHEYDCALKSGNVRDFKVMWWSKKYIKDFLME